MILPLGLLLLFEQQTNVGGEEISMVKIVINTTWGGFGLSNIGDIAYLERSGLIIHGVTSWPSDYSDWDISRNDPVLVQLIEEDAELYGDRGSRLRVIEIPDDVDWEISDYDGREHIAEKHRTWG